MTTFATGLNNQQSAYLINWRAIQNAAGTSYTYNYSNGGLLFARSNGGTAMSDTLPNPLTNVTDNNATPLPNGWFITLNNADVSADLTVALPAGIKLNGGTSSLVILPGGTVTIYSDGNNFFTFSNTMQARPFSAVTGASATFGAASVNAIINRSNGGSAMTDTLANPNTLSAGWNILIKNTDASATDTITPAAGTINGAANLSLTAAHTTIIWTDGTNFFASTPV